MGSLDELKTLAAQQTTRASEWNDSLSTIRAQASATSVILDQLAQTPPTEPKPRREYVAVVLAAPSQGWANDVVDRLRNGLPSGARVELGGPGEALRDAPPPTGYTVRCQVFVPGVPGAKASEMVRSVLARMDDLEVDYSEPIDLIVVAPRG